jgi:hypothetical protein
MMPVSGLVQAKRARRRMRGVGHAAVSPLLAIELVNPSSTTRLPCHGRKGNQHLPIRDKKYSRISRALLLRG